MCLSESDTSVPPSLPEIERYTDLQKIKQQGLKAPDLDKLDVKNPLHRRCVYVARVQNSLEAYWAASMLERHNSVVQ